MKPALLMLLAVGLFATGCSQPTTPRDTNAQQGNPKAQPEKDAHTGNSQPGDDQAGKDPHTQTRPTPR